MVLSVPSDIVRLHRVKNITREIPQAMKARSSAMYELEHCRQLDTLALCYMHYVGMFHIAYQSDDVHTVHRGICVEAGYLQVLQ